MANSQHNAAMLAEFGIEEDGRTPMHTACERGDIEQVRALLKKRVPIDYPDNNGWRPLHCAANQKCLEICALLLKIGVDCKAYTDTRTSALHFLCRIKEEEEEKKGLLAKCLKLMIDFGADINLRTLSGITPLHEAAYKGSESTAIFLLRLLAKIDVKDKYGETPLHFAMRAGRKEMVKILLEHGANPVARGKRGTCLDVANGFDPQEIAALVEQYKNKNSLHSLAGNQTSDMFDVIMAADVEELPKDIREMIEQADLPYDKVSDNFETLLRIIGYISKKKRFIYTEDKIILKKDDPTRYYKRLDQSSSSGGFGEVIQYRNIENKMTIAIKKLHHNSPKVKQRNLAEVSLLLSLNHPNIVRYLESYEFNSELWIVTEFLEGGTLKQAFESRKFTEGDISYIARQVLKSLHYLHTRKIIHRDIKSANIMLSISGDVKLIDFGLAADISKGPIKQIVGSPFWMPPEMILNRPCTTSADMWSFGVTLTEIANREIHFKNSATKSMISVANGYIPQLNDSIWSNHFRDFLSKCLQIDPEKRLGAEKLYQTEFIASGPNRDVFITSVAQIFLAQNFAF